MAEENKILIEVELDQEASRKKAVQLTAELAKLRKELAAQRKALNESNGENKEAAKAVERLSREVKEASTNLRNEQKEVQASNNSINGLRASVSKLTKERNNLNVSTAEGRARFDELTVKIKQQTDELKEQEKAVGDTRRNVGNYQEAITAVIGPSTRFGQAIAEISQLMPVLAKNLKGVKTALLSLPLLAITAALASFFTSTRQGRELLEKLGAAANTVFGFIEESLATVGKSIVEFFQNPLQNSLNALQGLGEAIQNRFQRAIQGLIKSFGLAGEAINALFKRDFEGAKKAAMEAGEIFVNDVTIIGDVIDVTKGATKATLDFAKAIEEKAKQGFKSAEADIAARAAIRDLTVAAARYANQAEEARRVRDDETKSLEERRKASDEVLKAEQARLKAEQGIVRARIGILEREIAERGEVEDGQLEQRAQYLAQLEQLELQYNRKAREAQRRNFAFQKEELQSQASLEALLLEEKLITENLTIEEQFKARLEILRKQQQAALVGISEGSEKEKEIRQKFRVDELKLEEEFNRKKADLAQQTSDLKVRIAEAEVATLKALLDKSIDDEKKAAEERKKIAAARLSAVGEFTTGFIQLSKALAGEQRKALAFQKTLAVADVLINLQKEIGALFADGASKFGIGGAIFAGIKAVASTARAVASIATINNAGFASGGYTGPGGVNEPAGTVHKGEVVWSQADVKAVGGPLVANSMRPTYAGGGMVGGMTASATQGAFNSAMPSALRNLQIFASITDIQKATFDYQKIQAKANA